MLLTIADLLRPLSAKLRGARSKMQVQLGVRVGWQKYRKILADAELDAPDETGHAKESMALRQLFNKYR